MMTQLRGDLRGADRCSTSGRLKLISGWLRSGVSVRAARGQAMAASEEGKQAVDQAPTAREVALKDVEASKEHCQLMEAKLETMRNERAADARDRKAEEEKMKAREGAVAGHDTELKQSARA